MKLHDSKRELLVRHLDGRLTDVEQQQMAEWLREDPDARAFLRELAEQAVMIADFERETEGRREALQGHLPERSDGSRIVPMNPKAGSSARVVFAIAASIALLLGVSFLLRPDAADREIATITGLNGAVQWTGDGGQVVRGLVIGSRLPGGTVEGMGPFSWFELEFKDGSSVSITGEFILTFSDLGQKKLHLKKGNATASVTPQPAGRPMLIQTPSAVLEVLGTRFEVEAGTASTVLDVSHGKVRVKRLSDGATVDVPAHHRVIAAADREMSAVPVPSAVDRWASQLRLGPEGALGKWLPGTNGQAARLRAVPYTTQLGRTIYTTGFGVSRGDKPPVTLLPGSSLRVRGWLQDPHPIYFGVTVRHSNGAFAGRFQTIRPAPEFHGGQDFEVVLPLSDFALDPSLHDMRDKLPQDPFQLVVESVWCHSLDKQASLAIAGIELIPPVAN
jgi:ferric-dicitrate binding protein FerR (iron transport regulator)